MALIIYGRKVREDSAEVAYAFGDTPDVSGGVLVIPVEDIDAWHLEGRGPGEPEGAEAFSARRVFQNALRGRRSSGTWPVDASHYA